MEIIYQQVSFRCQRFAERYVVTRILNKLALCADVLPNVVTSPDPSSIISFLYYGIPILSWLSSIHLVYFILPIALQFLDSRFKFFQPVGSLFPYSQFDCSNGCNKISVVIILDDLLQLHKIGVTL